VLARRFEVYDRLARGDTTELFRAVDQASGATVVVKVLLPDVLPATPPALRFEHEATLLETLDHPNVIALVHPLTVERGLRFFVMEHAERGALRDLVNADPAQPLDLYLTLALDVLTGLEHLHGQGIIHRDVKPENILVTRDTVGKLGDFGIARDDLNQMTVHGDVLGTPTFMAPEQARDPRDVGPGTDVFALGATLFTLVTGRPGVELIASGFRDDALAACPRLVRDLVSRATALRPHDRYGDAASMRLDVATALAAISGEDGGVPRRTRLASPPAVTA
jgi:serine/threonine-protein kinase